MEKLKGRGLVPVSRKITFFFKNLLCL
uniref:Uncharacterized protein n=1 Tax=Rhizophora mucronata TaxID=61149 RepID=A0A2P2N8H6_RHIMU